MLLLEPKSRSNCRTDSTAGSTVGVWDATPRCRKLILGPDVIPELTPESDSGTLIWR